MAGNTTVTAKLQDIIQGIAQFRPGNVTIGDATILGDKSGGPWCIIYPGAPRAEQGGSFGMYQYFWVNSIEIWRSFQGDDLEDIIADLDDVVKTLHAYPTLDGTANMTWQPPLRVSELQWLRGANDAPTAKPRLVGYRITHETMEDSVNTLGEFA